MLRRPKQGGRRVESAKPAATFHPPPPQADVGGGGASYVPREAMVHLASLRLGPFRRPRSPALSPSAALPRVRSPLLLSSSLLSLPCFRPPQASTVKIYCFSVSANYMRPWTKLEGESFTGSGCAIEYDGHGYLLTNSHVVRDHQLLQVQRHDRPGK